MHRRHLELGYYQLKKDKKEAGLSLGMSERSTMLHIIMPQAVKKHYAITWK